MRAAASTVAFARTGAAAATFGGGSAAGARRAAGGLAGGSAVTGRAGWDWNGIVKTDRQNVQRPCLPASFASRRYPFPHAEQLKTIFPASAAPADGPDGDDASRAAGAVATGAGVAARAADGGAGIRKTVWHVLHRPRLPARWAANS
jgi:hypothetical protein